MIENIRKYRGLIIVFVALVVFSLVIGIKEDLFTSRGTGDALFRIDGRTYGQREFQKLGQSSYELTRALAGRGDFGLFQFVAALAGDALQTDAAPEEFFKNRMLIRRAKDDFGVYPGEQEISERVKSMRAFTDQEGNFDNEAYRDFITKYIGRLGLTENDLRELVSDILAFEKISGIVGTGLSVNRDFVGRDLALQNQQVSGSLGRLDIDPFKDEVKPTDEEIKTYWETIQGAFTTEPTRRFSYVIITPDMPEAEEDEEESIADAAASDEEKKKKEEEKAKKAAELAEARRKKQLETDALVDDFVFQIEERKGEDFEQLATENEWEVKTTELFSLTAPPEDLNVNLRASTRGGKAVDELFKMEITTDPVSKISQPIAIGENQWLVARLDEVVDSRDKTFEEAKDEARAQYVDEKATEAMTTAIEKATDKIKTLVADGRSFADAATEAGLDGVKDFTKIISTYRPDPATEPRTLFDAVRYVDPGQLAEPVIEADRAFAILVTAREVVKQENASARIDSDVTSRTNMNVTRALNSWLAQRAEEAKIEDLWKK